MPQRLIISLLFVFVACSSVCGDQLTELPEECDDGNKENGDTCDNNCTLPRCGNLAIAPTKGEECDDGNVVLGDGCNERCKLEFCGDGIPHVNEECDDGDDSNADDCTTLCRTARCGDGFVKIGVEEQCDDANLNNNDSCLNNCKDASCGDGFLQSGVEHCDDGNTTDGDGCDSDCDVEFCGDGVTNNNEECDDQNQDNTDSCLNSCAFATCGDSFILDIDGDGVVESGDEECDDANQLNSDGCLNTCRLASCGDGFVNQGLEDCDPPNGVSCANSCKFVCAQNSDCTDEDACTQNERCDQNVCTTDPVDPDDQNVCTTDSCDPSTGVSHQALPDVTPCDTDGASTPEICVSAVCSPSFCGDGLVDHNAGEECEDGNNIDGDGCDSDCILSIKQIEAGGAHTCVLLRGGTVRCWGDNSLGQLGYGNTQNIGDDETLQGLTDIDIGGSVKQISAGGAHTCALLTGGTLRCWGAGADGRLGYVSTQNIGDNETPASVGDINIGGSVAQVFTGGAHTCVILTDGNVRCFGDGSSGQLGYGDGITFNSNDIGDDETPASAGDVLIGGAATHLGTGPRHTCVSIGGPLKCWGDSQFSFFNPTSPNSINGGSAAQLSPGSLHTCTLGFDGLVRCWGRFEEGRLGYPGLNFNFNFFPGATVDLGGPAAQLSTGDSFNCALVNGSVRCWGRGVEGQLGYGNDRNVGDNESPANAGDVNVGAAVAKITTGASHACALLENGELVCWGLGSSGQLGYGNTNNIGDDETPASVGGVLF